MAYARSVVGEFRQDSHRTRNFVSASAKEVTKEEMQTAIVVLAVAMMIGLVCVVAMEVPVVYADPWAFGFKGKCYKGFDINTHPCK
jgi:hypothetical protein